METWQQVRAILLLPGMVLGVIPSVIVYFTGVDSRGLWNSCPVTRFILPIIGLTLIGLGLSLMIATIRLFGTVGKGTLAPWNPPQRLVVQGIYRHVRNPMISGVLFVLLGETVVAASLPLLCLFILGVTINAVYIPMVEEPGLVRRFGEDYLAYKRNVPRWIPRWSPWNRGYTDGDPLQYWAWHSTDVFGSKMKSLSLRILGLVVCHVAFGTVAALILKRPVEPGFPGFCFVALLLSESGLLGFWAASATVSGVRRFAGATLGLGYLMLVATNSFGREGGGFALMMCATFTIAYAIFGVMRYFGSRLESIERADVQATAEVFQYSIRHLMGWTAAVAVLLALLRHLAPSRLDGDLELVLVFSLVFVVTPLVSVWAALSCGRPALKIAATLFVSPIPGFLLFFAYGRTDLWRLALITSLQGVFVIGSLLVVRSCGYRLVRHLPTPGPPATT